MKLSQIKIDHFNDSFKKTAEAASIGVQSIRNMIIDERECLLLADGNYILSSQRSIIFQVPEDPKLLDAKTRPEGYYRIEDGFENKSIAYWGDGFWLCHGDENQYWDDILNIKTIEPIDIESE